jgi:hypothetical protein
MRTLDKLLEDPRAEVARLVKPDQQSFVPVEYQRIGDYLINDSGVHRLFADADNELAVETLYPIPFYARGGEGKVCVRFFSPSGTVESITLLDRETIDVFRSLDDASKAKIECFISVCLLMGVT